MAWNLGDNMQIGIICEIGEVKKPVGIIAKSKLDIGFVSKDDGLKEVLDYIIDRNDISLPLQENLCDLTLSINKSFNIKDENYFLAVNYILPDKWRILDLTEYEDFKNFNEGLNLLFNKLIEEDSKYEK